MQQILVLDRNNFSDEESFYNQVDKIFTKNLNSNTGHNLSAFNDLLRVGFGVHEYEETISLKWINFEKSKRDLGEEFADTVMDIILSHEHIEF